MRLIPNFSRNDERRQRGSRHEPNVAYMRRVSLAKGERVRSDLNPPDEESQTLETAVRSSEPEPEVKPVNDCR